MQKETKVEIFNDTYIIRSESGEEYTHKLAGFINGKMNEVAQGIGTMSSLQVAILAALNISNELFQLQDKLEQQSNLIEKKTTRLISILDSRLEQPSTEEKIA